MAERNRIMIKEYKETPPTQKSGKRWIMIAVLSLALVTLGASAFLMRGRLQAESPVAVVAAEKTERVQIAIEGMTCSSCAVGVRMMLKRTEGVLYAKASYERKEAIVRYDPSRTTEDKILAAITNFGYGAKVK